MANPIHHWTPSRLVRQDGQTFVVTGANSGIGFEAAKILVGQGGHVIMACRNMEAGAQAKAEIEAAASGGGSADLIELDLASLASVRTAAASVSERTDKIDALINNAGVLFPPGRQTTEDGFEMQFGVNHLGHFLWTGLLAQQVAAVDGRTVCVSSSMHKSGNKRIRFEDPHWTSDYSPATAYAQSKLANALFALELNQRAEAQGRTPNAYICHPGYASTSLLKKGPGAIVRGLVGIGDALFAQSAERGAWPTVLCAADQDAVAGAYYGPTRLGELRGPVGECKLAAHARDTDAAAKLWDLSEELTGFSWAA
ncbi:MAG: oxidoreductase [Hyphomonadaceae bacterium]